MSIFIPKTITAGFQKRYDTYTGQLAYIIYTDEKGVLRKEKSWNGWRDETILPVTCENVPTSGFVLNKKTGGDSTGWNHRQTYVRVYDPRGLEFEITISNLLYILENTNSIKGKGLEGEFVYGWDGTELLLIPTSAPDYAELVAYNQIIYDKKIIKARDLKIGGTYKTKQNKELIYMGRFDYYDYGGTNKGKYYFFAPLRDKSELLYFQTFKTLNSKLIDVIDENCVSNYADLFKILEKNRHYSPIDESKDEYLPYTFEDFSFKFLKSFRWGMKFYFNGKKYNLSHRRKNHTEDKGYFIVEKYKDVYNLIEESSFDTLDEFFKNYNPCYLVKHLANGKIYGGSNLYE